MSSSQQQSTNSNNSRSQAANTQPQVPSNYQFNDYEDDPSLTQLNTSDVHGQPPNVNSDAVNDPVEQPYPNDLTSPSNDEDYFYDDDDDQDDDIPSDLEAELKATEEMIRSAQSNDNNGDVALFSDAVQNAFEKYENENSKYWNNNEPIQNTFSSEEQDEMFEQMRECMRFMSQEYSIAEMPDNLIERSQQSKLNPDAMDFRPSWIAPATTTTTTKTDNESFVVTSWVTCEAKIIEEEPEDS